MLAIPHTTQADIAFGNIRSLPKWETLPADFKRHNGNDYVEAISTWFFLGAKRIDSGVQIGKMKFVAKDGVDANKALAAIKACMSSWEPKHEHKEAGCAFMLSEWFDKSAA